MVPMCMGDGRPVTVVCCRIMATWKITVLYNLAFYSHRVYDIRFLLCYIYTYNYCLFFFLSLSISLMALITTFYYFHFILT